MENLNIPNEIIHHIKSFIPRDNFKNKTSPSFKISKMIKDELFEMTLRDTHTLDYNSVYTYKRSLYTNFIQYYFKKPKCYFRHWKKVSDSDD